MILNLADHIKAHLRIPEAKHALYSLVLLSLIGCTHYLFSVSGQENKWYQALVLRLYFLPVLYAALLEGALLGTIVGILGAVVHFLLMVQTPDRAYHLVHVEHLMEMPLLIALGLLVGLVQDHFHFIRKEKRELKSLFESYVSPHTGGVDLAGSSSFQGTEITVTIMFTDLKGFTSFSEDMSPKELLEFLNGYFSKMIVICRQYGGVVNKFLGDGMLIVFGLDESNSQHEEAAIRCAIAMHHCLSDLNKDHKQEHEIELELSVGINTGKVVAGNIGSYDRREFTVIGDNVNLAARIESLTRKYNAGILISNYVYRKVYDNDEFNIREIDSVTVKGKRHPVVLYEVFNCCAVSEKSKKLSTLADFYSGLQFYKLGQWDDACKEFQKVKRDYPEDIISAMYLKRINKLKLENIQDFDGIYKYDEK